MIETKQELLNYFSDINIMYNNPSMYQTLSNMIDELLEQQPCEDCISREAVEKITWEEPSYTDALNILTEVREKVRALPSVTPSRPKGKWDILSDDDGMYGICSVCQQDSDFSHYGVAFDFCPNCGADMRGDKNAD